jgi:hypothetical protein
VFAAIFIVPIALALLLIGNTVIAVVGRAVRKRSNRSEPLANP